MLPKFLLPFLLLAIHANAKPFSIEIVDQDTKRSVPLMRIETVNHLVDYTDNTGIVTFDEPGLADREVWFGISGDGYELEPDGFGFRGIRAKITAGGKSTVEVKRINIAERIQRLTGGGRYVHGARLGMQLPDEHPLLNTQVFGCDSVDTAIFGDKMFWIWGDTSRPSYPLGNFQTTMASTVLPGEYGCRPDGAVNYDYFKSDSGFVKSIAPIPGDSPTWLAALVSLKDQSGAEHLCATYAKIKAPMTVYERGLCEFDPATEIFKTLISFPPGTTLFPDGHTFRGAKFLYFGQAVPTLRIDDSYECWKDPNTYQKINPDVSFTDTTTGKPVKAHNGSITWNPWRKKWISIFTEQDGSSPLGEIRYAEAPAPEGPWRKCVKIVTHANYSFYNPMQHPEFAENGGQTIWFEGTYTATFSGNPNPTPRHDYNQILYRLNLQDQRLIADQK